MEITGYLQQKWGLWLWFWLYSLWRSSISSNEVYEHKIIQLNCREQWVNGFLSQFLYLQCILIESKKFHKKAIEIKTREMNDQD